MLRQNVHTTAGVRPKVFVFVIVFVIVFVFLPHTAAAQITPDDNLLRSCPSAADTSAARTSLLQATMPGLAFTPDTTVDFNPVTPWNKHSIFTMPAQDFIIQQLSVLPPDGSPSLKLNSYITQDLSVAAARYRLDVDTAILRTLILRYAAVMQNPDHDYYDQPRFTFDILDSTLLPVDTNCYSAIFVADTALGWDTLLHPQLGTLLWKNWTSVCVDLSPLHGQTIYIQLAAYDCARGAHFGYVYYSFGCTGLAIEASGCGRYRHYTAPEGFTYHWYPESKPWITLDTARTCVTDWSGRVCCDLGFRGNSGSQYCYSTLTADPPPIPAPVPACIVDTIDSVGCSVRILVRDSSHIHFPDGYDTTDTPYDTVYTLLIVDSDTLAIGDTLTLTQGEHSIALIAALDTLLCYDDTSFKFSVTDFCHCYDTLADTVGEALLPYLWQGVLFAGPADTTLIHPGTPGTCDTLLTLRLQVCPNTLDTAYLYLCPAMIPFHLNDTVSVGCDTTVVYPGRYGQDSTIVYRLFPLANTDTSFTDTILESQLPWLFFDTLFTDTVTNHPFHLFNEQGCDSTIHYSLYIFWDGDHCDTSLTFPNLVTPNADGINDRFVVGGLLENNCFKFNDLLVYDRTGRLVYHGHNIAKEDDFWDPDGKQNNQYSHRAPDGTYFYIFKAHGVTIHTMRQGVIEVLR